MTSSISVASTCFPLDALPDEALERVCLELSNNDLSAMARVCRRFRNIVAGEHFFRQWLSSRKLTLIIGTPQQAVTLPHTNRGRYNRLLRMIANASSAARVQFGKRVDLHPTLPPREVLALAFTDDKIAGLVRDRKIRICMFDKGNHCRKSIPMRRFSRTPLLTFGPSNELLCGAAKFFMRFNLTDSKQDSEINFFPVIPGAAKENDECHWARDLTTGKVAAARVCNKLPPEEGCVLQVSVLQSMEQSANLVSWSEALSGHSYDQDLMYSFAGVVHSLDHSLVRAVLIDGEQVFVAINRVRNNEGWTFTIKVYDSTTGACFPNREMTGKGWIQKIFKDSEHFITVTQDGEPPINIYSANNNMLLRTIQNIQHVGGVAMCAGTPRQGAKLICNTTVPPAIGGQYNSVFAVVDVSSGACDWVRSRVSTWGYRSIVNSYRNTIAVDGDLVAAIPEGGSYIEVGDLRGGEMKKLPLPEPSYWTPRTIAFHDGRVVVGDGYGRILAWDLTPQVR